MAKTNSGLRDMTVGSPVGHIVFFALPLLAGSFFQQMYNMVDSWVVGNYVGNGALAAVGVGFPVIFLFTSLFMGLSNGATVVISQYFGAGKQEQVRMAVDTTYTAFVAAAIPVTAVALAMVKPLLFILRVDPSAYEEAWVYVMIVCAGLTGTIGYNLNAGILNGLGNSRTTLLFLGISAVLNIILDLVLVLNAGMGVAGVALGTIISQSFSWLFGLLYINHNYPQIAIRPFCFRFDREIFRQIMGIGLPAGLQNSLVSIGVMLVMSKVNTFGDTFTAGYNVGNKLDNMAFLVIMSLTNAVTAYVGQNTGARRLDRVRQGVRITVIASAVWSLLMTVVLVRYGYAIIGWFTPDPAVVDAGYVYVKCVMTCYLPFSIFFVLNGAMRGAGDSFFPMCNSILSMIILRVPLVYLLANHFGPAYMYYGIGIGWVGGFFLCTGYYFSGRWKRKGLLAQEE